MTPRLLLICHASTSATKAAAFPADEPLDERGLRRAAAADLVSLKPDRCWTSPALRARQTAEALKLDAQADDALRDCDYGRWAGQSLAELQRTGPEALSVWLTDPASAPHGGESVADVQMRVAAWLHQREPDDGVGIAVTHAAVIRAAIVTVIAAPLNAFWRIDVDPLTMTDLRHSGGRWTLRSTGCSL